MKASASPAGFWTCLCPCSSVWSGDLGDAPHRCAGSLPGKAPGRFISQRPSNSCSRAVYYGSLFPKNTRGCFSGHPLSGHWLRPRRSRTHCQIANAAGRERTWLGEWARPCPNHFFRRKAFQGRVCLGVLPFSSPACFPQRWPLGNFLFLHIQVLFLH